MKTNLPAGRAARGLLFPVLIPALITAATLAQGPNLITNSSFEAGVISPWIVTSGAAAVVSYGGSDIPNNTVAAIAGGGGLLLRDGGNGVIEQIVVPPSLPPGSALEVTGWIGGGANDWTRLTVRILDASGSQIGFQASAWVTETQRNQEAVLLLRRMLVPVTANAAQFAVRVEFANQCCGVVAACADRIEARVITNPTVPAALSIGTDLVVNGGMEAGWSPSSPLGLLDGWEGNGGACPVHSYSNTIANIPSGLVSCIIDGARPNPSCGGGASGNMLAHSGNSSLIQTIDARGSTGQFASGNLSFLLGAHLGGAGADGDVAQAEARFRSNNGQTLGTLLVGPVTNADRNNETVLVRRSASRVVPANTAFIDIVVSFTDVCCGGSFAKADNIEAQLIPTPTPQPVALNVNLLPNPSFENGSVPGSPLEFNNSSGWSGGSGYMPTVQYGTANTPSPAFAAANGLGSQLLRHNGTTTMRTECDLRGSQALIAAGRLAMQGSVRLGGAASDGDTARVGIRFENFAGVPVGARTVMPAVTAADRGNQTTLIYRESAPFLVPAGATKVIVELEFIDVCCSGSFALADDIRLVAFDTVEQASASPFPGTPGDDLVLLTGINQLPTTGIGHYVKDADAGDILRVQIVSPTGSLDGAFAILGANIYTPGGAPSPFPSYSDLALDPSSPLFFMMLGSLQFGPMSPTVIPVAQGGTNWGIAIPPVLTGYHLLLQAVGLPTQASMPVPPNGKFFTSQGHEIR